MRAILLMACSATKSHIPDIPSRLYKGVMWASFHKHSGGYLPEVLTLSAEYGCIDNRVIRATYDRKMDGARADEMLANLAAFDNCAWDASTATHVLLAGGETYKRVMRALVARKIAQGALPAGVIVEEVSGGIGEQRSQLGAWLRRMAALCQEALDAEPEPWWVNADDSELNEIARRIRDDYRAARGLATAPQSIAERELVCDNNNSQQRSTDGENHGKSDAQSNPSAHGLNTQARRRGGRSNVYQRCSILGFGGRRGAIRKGQGDYGEGERRDLR